MNIEKQALAVSIISFVIILLLGIYITASDSGGYMFLLGRGRGGGNAPYYISGKEIIAIAFIFGVIMFWMFLGSKKQRRKNK